MSHGNHCSVPSSTVGSSGLTKTGSCGSSADDLVAACGCPDMSQGCLHDAGSCGSSGPSGLTEIGSLSLSQALLLELLGSQAPFWLTLINSAGPAGVAAGASCVAVGGAWGLCAGAPCDCVAAGASCALHSVSSCWGDGLATSQLPKSGNSGNILVLLCPTKAWVICGNGNAGAAVPVVSSCSEDELATSHELKSGNIALLLDTIALLLDTIALLLDTKASLSCPGDELIILKNFFGCGNGALGGDCGSANPSVKSCSMSFVVEYATSKAKSSSLAVLSLLSV